MRELLLLLLFLLSTTLFAQDQTATPSYDEGETQLDEESADESYETEETTSYTTVPPERVSEAKGYSSESIPVKRFDKKKWEEVVAGEDYSEIQKKKKIKDKDSDGDGEASNKRFERTDDEDEDEDYNFSFSSPIGSPLVTIIFYAVVAGVIGYILFLIIKNTSVKSNAKTKQTIEQNASGVVDDIKELEIDRLLREALAAGDYRLAIRIYFLGLLKKLDEDGVIAWKRDKTNQDYLLELFRKSFYFDDIKRITLLYEEVWYGEHNFSNDTYQEIISSFKTVNHKINVAKSGEN